MGTHAHLHLEATQEEYCPDSKARTKRMPVFHADDQLVPLRTIFPHEFLYGEYFANSAEPACFEKFYSEAWAILGWQTERLYLVIYIITHQLAHYDIFEVRCFCRRHKNLRDDCRVGVVPPCGFDCLIAGQLGSRSQHDLVTFSCQIKCNRHDKTCRDMFFAHLSLLCVKVAFLRIIIL